MGAKGLQGSPGLGDVERLMLALVRRRIAAGNGADEGVDERHLAAEAGLLSPSAAADPRSYLAKRPAVSKALAEMEARGWVLVESAVPGWSRVRLTPRGLRYGTEFMGPVIGEDARRSKRGRIMALAGSAFLGVGALLASVRRFLLE